MADPGEDGTDLVGAAGLRTLENLGLEIYYSLAPGRWGNGFATEAARAVVEYALGPLGLHLARQAPRPELRPPSGRTRTIMPASGVPPAMYSKAMVVTYTAPP